MNLQYDTDRQGCAACLDRPAWTSEQKTGMFEAFKHRHTLTKDKTGVIKDFYK